MAVVLDSGSYHISRTELERHPGRPDEIARKIDLDCSEKFPGIPPIIHMSEDLYGNRTISWGVYGDPRPEEPKDDGMLHQKTTEKCPFCGDNFQIEVVTRFEASIRTGISASTEVKMKPFMDHLATHKGELNRYFPIFKTTPPEEFHD